MKQFYGILFLWLVTTNVSLFADGAMDLDYKKRWTPCSEQYFAAVRLKMIIPHATSNTLTTFSVNNSGGSVELSSGNLQYNANSNTFRFATEQTEVVATAAGASLKKSRRQSKARATGTPGATFDNGTWIDNFGWGTSGFSNDTIDQFVQNSAPTSTSSTTVDVDHNTYGYGPSWDLDNISPNIDNNSGYSSNYDWGFYNDVYCKWAIYDSLCNRIGFDSTLFTKGLWRTLTIEEWDYMLNGRPMEGGLTPSTYCTVNGVPGLIVFPDHFLLAEVTDQTIVANINNSLPITSRTLTAAQFQRLEWDGCIFLPQVTGYWSSTATDASQAESITISANTGDVSITQTNRCTGLAVRLARDVYGVGSVAAITR